jgi:hypothetical protein
MSAVALTWITVGACLTYIIVQDANVYDFLVLASKSASIWVQRQWFKIRYHPESPWIRWEINRNADKMAKEFLENYNKEKDNGSSGFDQ